LYDFGMVAVLVGSVVPFIIATAVPLIVLYIIYKLNLYGTGSFSFVLFCFAWGIAAFGAAYFVNPAVSRLLHLDMVHAVAPVAEEILKALILLYLVRRVSFTYFVDGAIYGFAIGIGFAIAENYQYLLGAEGAVLVTAVARVISTNLMHATASALVGIALGFARFQRLASAIPILLAGWLLAMSVHAGFNHLVTADVGALLLLYAAAVGIGGAGFIVFAIKRGLAEEKTWIEEKLGEADRVTTEEAAVVHRLEDTGELLSPIVERFGSEKAQEVERFLVLQARLGIYRKTLEKLNDEKMIKAVEAQMDEVREKMDASRRAVGAYCMLYLRNIFPPEVSPLWDRLESIIQERIASRPAASGPSLWDTLGERTAKAAGPPEEDDAR
jgi:RsiW-degrading membrane proteinase PrsW (M82 family)